MAPIRPVRVFLDVVPWFCRSRNTDWRYVRFLIPQIARWQPEIEFIQQQSPAVTLAANTKYVRARLESISGGKLRYAGGDRDAVDREELLRSGADVVFSHREFPRNAEGVPVVWQSSLLDPVMVRSYAPDDWTRHEQFCARSIEDFQRAAAVQVSTEAEVRRLRAELPHLAERFAAVPFFTPQLVAAPRSLLARHERPRVVRLLFVGNDVRRKGLDLLVEAFSALPAHLLRRAHLTIVSNFSGPAVAVPSHPRITVRTQVRNPEVLQFLRASHVLVNLARFESYGLVFVEAMSQGVACVGPDWEVQRELLDDGNAGINLPCSAAVLQPALARLIEDDDFRMRLATAGWERFQTHYAPPGVARKYAELFARTARSAHPGRAPA